MSRWKLEDIKKLCGFTKPIITRNGTQVLSVGIKEGERYYQYDKTTSKITGSLLFEESPHRILRNLSRYLKDIAYLIDKGQIYIKYVEPEPEPEVIIKKVIKKEVNSQTSMF